MSLDILKKLIQYVNSNSNTEIGDLLLKTELTFEELDTLKNVIQYVNLNPNIEIGDLLLKTGMKFEESGNIYEAIRWYNLSAAHKNVHAQCKMGDLSYDENDYSLSSSDDYWYTIVVTSNLCPPSGSISHCSKIQSDSEDEAEKWYEKAANQGCAEAQFKLGMLQLRKFRFKNDWDNHQAVELVITAAKNGYSDAQYQLSFWYKMGYIFEYDIEKSIEWFEKAAESMEANIQAEIADKYFNGNKANVDIEKAIKWYRLAAEQGDSYSIKKLAVIYYYGKKGVVPNYPEAIKWYRKAAEQGDVGSMIKLGNIYKLGKVVKANPLYSFEWFEKAANEGDEKSLQIIKEDFEYYVNAAKQGDSSSKLLLGDMYYYGTYVKQDYEEAFKWYKIAAEQGVSIAQLKVGDMYYNGLGLKQDYSKAVKWYKLAASKNIEAQIRLGDCYYCGIGVEMNYAEANRWYNRSKDIQTDDETLYIHKGRIICRYNKHNIEPVTAIMTGQNNSEIHFNVFYCNNCGKFFVDYESYKLYRKKFGIILGDIKMLQGDNYYSVYVSRNEYSPLKLCGYSVGNSSNLAIDQRREIIVYCIETDIMSKYEIINLLRMLINVNGSKSGNEYARYEWESDLMFTLDYNIRPLAKIEK